MQHLVQHLGGLARRPGRASLRRSARYSMMEPEPTRSIETTLEETPRNPSRRDVEESFRELADRCFTQAGVRFYTWRMPEPAIEIRRGYVPGAIGRVVELSGTYYHDHWGFGLFFEAKVAADLAEFLSRYDPARDGFWTAWVYGRIEGHISIDGRYAADQGAHLRYFIVSDVLRGHGIGNRLMETAMDFCREAGHKRVFLWTFEGLHAARHLYEKHGFRLVEQRLGSQWGKEVTEQQLVRAVA